MTDRKTEKSYRGIIIAIGLSLLWMVATAIVGTLGLYEYQRDAFHLMIIVTVALPSVVFLLLFMFSLEMRKWTQSLNLAMLTLPHAWRTVGYTFLVLWFYKILPAGFAAPAGFGDFTVAILAPFVAVALWYGWKNSVRYAVWFHILGAVDLVLAIVTGTSAFGVLPENIHIVDPLTAFPMVIIPTVFVPLLLMSHFMVFCKVMLDKKDEK
jgi:hypothetical protein